MTHHQLFSGLIIAGLFGATVAGCGKKDDNDDNPSSGGTATGGVSTGGFRTGGTSTGGIRTGGTGTGGGSTGGAQTGGAATGGDGGAVTGGAGGAASGGDAGAATGGAVTGGSAGAATGGVVTGGAAGAATGGTATGGVATGGAATGGAAGATAGGGEGGGGPVSYCSETLFVPLAAASTGTDFEIDYGATTTVDLTDATLTVTLRADMAGNAGGIQVYLKNGAAQSYSSAYLGWVNLSDISDWTTLTYDLSTVTGTGTFNPSAIQFVGINVAAGGTWTGAVFDDTTVYVDSITFGGAAPDLTFDGTTELAINTFNTPITGSAIGSGVCEDTGTGGAGGAGGVPGSAGSAGTPSIGGSAGTPGGGAAGMPTGGGAAGTPGGGAAGMPTGGGAAGMPTGGGAAGMPTGGGAGGADPGVVCPGCAVLSVPFDAIDQSAQGTLTFAPSVDIPAAGTPTLTIRGMAPGAGAGVLQAFVQQNGPSFGMCFQGWTNLSSLGTLQDIAIPLGACGTNTSIGRVGLQLLSGSTAATWANPTVFYIDSIALTGASAAVPAWTFSGVGSIAQATYPGNGIFWLSNTTDAAFPAGTTLAWLAN